MNDASSYKSNKTQITINYMTEIDIFQYLKALFSKIVSLTWQL